MNEANMQIVFYLRSVINKIHDIVYDSLFSEGMGLVTDSTFFCSGNILFTSTIDRIGDVNINFPY